MPSNRTNNQEDPKRPDQIHRRPARPYDNELAEYMIILTIVWSLYALLTKRPWCAWLSLCSAVRCFAVSPVGNKQGICCIMLAISAITLCYLEKSLPTVLEFFEDYFSKN
ncbi:Protein Asterix like protein [Argiope bruennichi]|uniref:Protein Asterix like protein n=1 Tax=Argiope bruennichi TaxID=94029 RepID=A0A8T0F898_ARGBR|nr:Protein Asterix like protein [Argiope bruennichi]